MIYLDENGVTVKAQRGAKVGQEYELNGQNYLVVDRDLLEDMVNKGKDVSKVVTTRVKMMLNLFCQKNKFNQDIGSWDVSNVYSMTRMFRSAECFNQDISFWDVTGTRQMEEMFLGASSFNNDISNWDVKNVENMRYMFANTERFNQPIGKWNIGSYADISYMFYNAESFNQDLSNWDVSTSNPISLFEGAASFNQDLKNWKFAKWGKGHSCNRMFKNAISFNGNISSWDVFGITHMDEMFMGAQSFNQDISSWDVSNVIKMDRMFSGAESFNQNLTKWNINFKLNLKNPTGIFHKAKNFNLDYNPFEQKVTKSVNKVENKELNTDDKKIISKFKKLFQSEDLDIVNMGIQLIRSIERDIVFEFLLKDCEINEDGDLVLNQYFKSFKLDDELRDYTFLSVLAYTPQNSEIHESLKIKNIKILNLYNGDKDKKNISLTWSNFISPLHVFENLTKLTLHPYDHYHGDLKNIIKCSSLKELIIPEVKASGLNNLEFLENLSNLIKLEINNIKRKFISSLDGLRYLNNLKELSIGFYHNREYETKIDEFNHLNKLEKLSLENIVFEDFNIFINCKSSLNELRVSNSFNSFDGLNNLINIKSFEIYSNSGYQSKINIINLNNFVELVNLKSLSLNRESLSGLSQLKRFKSLEKLKIDISSEILDGCDTLKELEICCGTTNHEGLKHLKSLEKLSLKLPWDFKNLNISNLQNLKELSLNSFKLSSNMELFKEMPKLQSLKLESWSSINLEILKYFPNLKALEILKEYNGWDIHDLKAFSSCLNLTELKIFSKDAELSNLSGLADLKKLQKLTLQGINQLNRISKEEHLRNIEEIKSSSLRILELNNCYSIMKTYKPVELNLEKFIINGKSI